MSSKSRAIAYAAVASPSHDAEGHPEHAGRVPAIQGAIADAGLVPALRHLPRPAVATREQLGRCHDAGYIDALEAAMASAPGYVDPAPTYITPDSFQAALEASGATIAVVEALLNGRADVGLALVRPPGHHALRGAAMGFCLFGNVAIAAREAQAQGLERVMIVDFDVHHGNGTQDIFYADGSVLFVSLHESGIYPGSGLDHEQGREAGLGTTINLPLPSLSGDRAMRQSFRRIVEPAAGRFQPELILVSAGFDAHFHDPLANLQVSGSGYHEIALSLQALADRHCEGRLAFVLEGGYDLAALGNGVVNLLLALVGEPPDESLGSAPFPEPDRRVDALLEGVAVRHGLI